MDCRDVKALLGEHAVAPVGGERGEPLRMHLAECASCARRLERLRGTVDLVRAEAAADERRVPPANILAIVGARAEAPAVAAEPSRTRRTFRFLLRCAALFLAVVGAAAALRTRVAAKDGWVRVELRLPGAADAPDPDAQNMQAFADALGARFDGGVRAAVHDAMLPFARDLVRYTEQNEEVRRRDMAEFARYFDGARSRDAVQFASMLEETHDNLAATQDALVQVASRPPVLLPSYIQPLVR